MITIFAKEFLDGRRSITVTRTSADPALVRAVHRRLHAYLETRADAMSGLYQTLADARSALMSIYGIAWFNMARAQLKAIEAIEAISPDDQPAAVPVDANSHATAGRQS